MLKNYLLVALRNLYREKIYAIINIIGLSLAIACCLILALYVRSELTYDQHHLNHAQLYRIANEYTNQGKANPFAASSPALGPLMIREYPQLGDFVRFRGLGNTLFKADDTEIFWDSALMADDNVLDAFTHKIIYGDATDALVDPSGIVISESFAQAYFGNANPIGETIRTDTSSFQVKAVFEDFPDNTHLKYDALISYNIMRNFGQSDESFTPRNMFNIGITTYFHLADGVNEQALQRLLDEFYETKMKEQGEQIDLTAKFYTQPLLDVHFDNRWQGGPPTGNIFYVYGFIAVAFFVLLVACINYTNLATARATKRAKEVGMRKVLGAEKVQLITQFMGESIFYALLALVIGLVCVELAELFTPLNAWLGKSNLLNLSQETTLIAWIVAGTLAIGMMAGAYPAFYLSSIAPLSSITSTKKPRRSGIHIRQILVFIQFFVSIGVVASTLLMGLQMQYVASKPLGYNNENKISVQLRGVDVLEKIPVIRNELLSNPNVLGVVETSFVPGGGAPINLMQVENNNGEFEQTGLYHFAVGPEFVDVMGLEIVEGRDFSTRLLTDVGTSVVVNETLVKNLGWENPIGKRIQNFNARVVGVMKDFHIASMHEPVPSMLIRPFPPADFSNTPPAQRNLVSRTIAINIAGEDIYQTINHIEAVMLKFDPEHPFEFRFFDDMLNELYTSETNLMKLTGVFAAICIFISCLGLYGLSAFTTEQRTKEIGVRKVLGASTSQIIVLLAQYQMVLVVIAAVIASITSYVVMDNWLSTFAYRTDIRLWIFAAAALSVAAVAFVTVALQSSRTAQSNPVDALRYE